MAGEIEQYLMDKFQKGIESNNISSSNSSKIPLLTKFQAVQKLLDQILNSPPQPAVDPVALDPTSIREKLYFLNDLLTEAKILSKKKRSFYYPRELLEINSIRTKLYKIKAELELALPKTPKPNPQPQPQPQPQPNGGAAETPRRGTTTTTTIHGFDQEFSSLERLILRDDGRFKAAAIIGAEGVGKTTLCETVFNMEKVKSRFSPRAWVSSTSGIFHDEEYKRNPRIAFARRILASLGVESEMVERVVEDHGLRGLVCALHLELIGKRYLIVLDDARETDPWYGRLGSCLGEEKGGWEECLGYGLPKGSGGMVIVTSRNEGVAKRMIGDEGSLIPVLPLSDGDSCWKIFKDTVEKDGLSFSPLNEEELKREVLEKCGGIPLGAKMLGMAMYEQLQKANLVHQRHQYPSVQKH